MGYIHRLLVGTSALGLVAGLGATPAQAADPAPTQAAPTQAAAPDSPAAEADEIVVTANKRNESASRVGASITALSGQALANRNITSAVELARTVPSLALAPSTHGTPVFTLRGVGYNSDSLAVYPAVSISLDQAPMPFPVLAGHTMYDLERVEVLKGPQGILFGQNSTGGAVNYVAAKPTKTLEAGATVDYGRFNEVHATAYISGPVSSTVGVRVAIDALHRDGWQYNYARTDKNAAQDYVAGRIITDWQASDRVKFELDVNASIDRSEPQALQQIASLPSNPAAPSPQERSAVLAPDNLRIADWSILSAAPTAERATTPTARPSGNRRLGQVSLHADVELSDAVSLTSITTYNHLSQKMRFDLDGSQFELVDAPISDGKIDDLNQEIRLSNASSAVPRFRWTVGANYNYSKINEKQLITYGENSLSSAGNFFIHASEANQSATINTYAAFANGEYDIVDRVTLKGGLRYTRSANHSDLCPRDGSPDENENRLFSLLSQLVGGRSITLQPGNCYPLNDQGLPINAQGEIGGPVRGNLTEDNLSWRAGIDFKPSRATLFYANVSRGYKAGSFPVVTPAQQAQLRPATQESVTAYEAGFKTRVANNLLQWSGAIFYNDYKDKQVQGTINTPTFGLLQRLDNIPKSRIFGVETDVVLRPAPGLTLTGSASYLNTKVTEYNSISVFGAQTNFAGNRLPFAPKWSLVGDVDYQIRMQNGGNLFLGGSVNYRTDVDTYVGGSVLVVPDNGANRWTTRIPFRIDGYALVDARIGYEFPGDKVTISAWGKNVFNTFNVTNVISYNDIITRTTGMPVSYGLRVAMKFR